MLRQAVARLLSEYQWFINPFAGRRDRIVLLMLNYGFRHAAYKFRKFYNVYYDGGRLVGIFYTNVPGELFMTQIRVCVYHKREFTGSGFGGEKYLLVYMFTHREGDGEFKRGSHFKTDWEEFAGLQKFLKSGATMAEVRARAFSIQEFSKVSPVHPHTRKEKT